jgi:hypothetical protein
MASKLYEAAGPPPGAGATDGNGSSGGGAPGGGESGGKKKGGDVIDAEFEETN